MITSATAAIASSLAVTAGALGWGAVSDFRRYIIPNTVPAVIAIGFGVTACFMPLPFLSGGLIVGLSVLVSGAVLFARGWMGGGDVKLLAATALWAGPSFLSNFAIATGLSGAVLAAVMLSPLRRFMPAPSAEALNLTGSAGGAGRQPMPFGVAIAAGGLTVLALYLPLLR